MKVKIFLGRVNIAGDFDNMESRINQFIADKNVIDIKQSISPSLNDGNTAVHFLVTTIMYE
mgnify:CR=1 FL=1